MKYIGKVLHIKQGETFAFSGTVLKKDDRTLLPVAGHTVRSQIRQPDAARTLVAALTCQWLADGAVRIFSPGDSINWPVGAAFWDIQIVDAAGQTRATDSVEVVIERHVTRSDPT